MNEPKYDLDVNITWREIFTIWQNTKRVKGFKAWLSYHLSYGKYGPLANFGAEVINQFQIPYKSPVRLSKQNKKENE